MRKIMTLLLITSVLLAACGSSAATVPFIHLHGLGYDERTGELIAPAHDGLRSFDGKGWAVVPGPKHDYMGFVQVTDGFYSSGHPEPGFQGLANPIGLVWSDDVGQSMDRIAFEGESDFHVMGVGYYSHAIYVWEPYGNSVMTPGFYYSLDRGTSWTRTNMPEVPGEKLWFVDIVVHPTEPATFAVVTGHGLFLSRDFGQTYEMVVQGGVSAAAFRFDREAIVLGTTGLFEYDLTTGTLTQFPASPKVSGDDIYGYIALKPGEPDTIALGSFEVNVFLSKDGGKSWDQIVTKAKGRGR